MIRKYFFSVTFLLLALLLASPTKGELVRLGIPAGQELAKDNKLTKVSHALVALQEAHENHVQLRSLEPFKPSIPYLRVVDGLVVIDAVASGEAKDLLADLEVLGLQNGAAFGRMVSGLLPIEAIEELKDLDSLKFVRPAYMVTNVGDVTSQGDVAMRSDIARTTFGVDGAGVTVGTLSDSFDCLGDAAADVASGDLPAGINVLEEEAGCISGTDEGRAMMQLIHDVAPGASQAFHTGFNGPADFAQGIIDLANAGANVIVDDVFYLTEPFYQDGPIAQAVDQVEEMGIPYFSAAGNDGRNAYASIFRNTGVSGSRVIGFRGERHDFDPGPAVDDLQTVTFGPGFTTIIFQWSSPYASACPRCPGATTDLDFVVYNMAGDLVFASLIGNIGGDPTELIFFTNNGTTNLTFQIGLERVSGPAPDHMKYLYMGPMTVVDHPTNSGTIFGHANAAGAEAVGAAFYDDTPAFGQDPPLLEPFSSAGPQPIFFDARGKRNSSPEIRPKPEIVGPDGTNTTFFGFDVDSDGDPNFFGSSAAAPHAAAVAALILQNANNALAGLNNNNALTPNQVYKALETTAIDMLTPGFDDDSGFGFIQADAAIQADIFDDIDPSPLPLTIQSAVVSKKIKGAKRKSTDSGTITFMQESNNGGDFVLEVNGRSFTGTFSFERKKGKIKKTQLVFDQNGLSAIKAALEQLLVGAVEDAGGTLTDAVVELQDVIIKSWKFSSEKKSPNGKAAGKLLGGKIKGKLNGESKEGPLKWSFKMTPK